MPTHRRRPRLLSRWATALGLAVTLGCGSADPLEQARSLHASGRFGASLEPLRELIAERPDDPEVNYLYGVALARSGSPQLALWSLRRAGEDPDWMVPSHRALAQAALRARNQELAIEAATRVLEVEPEDVGMLVLRAEAKLDTKGKGDYEGGLADVDRAVELEPDNFHAYVIRAVLLLTLERIEEATEAIEDLGRRSRDQQLTPEAGARYCAASGTFAKERLEPELADEIFGSCLAEFPSHPVVVWEAIGFYDGQGRADRSMEILEGALEAEPTALPFRRAIAGRLRGNGDVEGAEQLLLEGTELDPPRVAVGSWMELSSHYIQVEDYDKAAEATRRALELQRNPPPQAIFAHADLLVMANRFDEAREAVRPLDRKMYTDVIEGRIAYKEGRLAEAYERLTATAQVWPDNAGVRYYAARSAEQMGEFDDAIEHYRGAVRASAASTDAGFRLGRLLAAQREGPGSLVALRHHADAHPADVDAELLYVRLAHAQGRQNPVRIKLSDLMANRAWRARATALAAELAAERGPGQAVELILSTPGLDLDHPRDAEALRALVGYLVAGDRADRALERVEAALAAHPDAADFHEIHGLALEGVGAPREQGVAAYERAVELDPEHTRALAALGRLAAEAGDVDGALGFYARAVEADPDALDPSPRHAGAALARSAGRAEEAERWYEELLVEHPWDAEAALALAELRLARGAGSDRTLELARRASRFGGGAAAWELRARIHEQRGETELAERSRSRAQGLGGSAGAAEPEPGNGAVDGVDAVDAAAVKAAGS